MKVWIFATVLALAACGGDDDATNNANNANNQNNANNANNQNNANNANNANNTDAELDLADLNLILTTYVDASGQVDYAALAESDDLEALDRFVVGVGNADVSQLNDDEKLAFYINAYNAHVLRDVVGRYPIDSVMDVAGYFDDFDFNVAGQDISLNELENDIIRVDFAEPRIHFALVCAAKSCPRLRQEAYEGTTLEASLEAAAQEFVPASTTVNGTDVTTSRLFDWFGEDFVAASGSVGAYLAQYLPDDADVLNDNPTIDFSEYDWALNEQ